MIDDKYNIKYLVSSIYECQKKIILNRRLLQEMKLNDENTDILELENQQLVSRIEEFQIELKKKYQFSY